ncbi:hypothetical protein CBR_g21146 [Chara braunii]|uniref:Uncharacterized protein n=1 Tax=Chara braunii TaxID=69332 RepID=A0A388L0Q6_CHABU|nr:hypothetical protein CBR_g21146 [Chara braunii]|eukprot:GBG75904.1 hypothetical protein CBR_g21146 [Chara braunii]
MRVLAELWNGADYTFVPSTAQRVQRWMADEGIRDTRAPAGGQRQRMDDAKRDEIQNALDEEEGREGGIGKGGVADEAVGQPDLPGEEVVMTSRGVGRAGPAPRASQPELERARREKRAVGEADVEVRDTGREKRARQTTIDEMYDKEKLAEFTDTWLQWIYVKGYSGRRDPFAEGEGGDDGRPDALESMLHGDAWARIPWEHRLVSQAQRVHQQIRDGEFWRCVDYAILVMAPVHQLLRRMDRGGMMMSVVYEWSQHVLRLMRRVDVPVDMIESTNAEEDLIGFLFGSVRPGRRQLIAQELIAPIVQLADDLSPDIYCQSDNSPAPYIFERSFDPYLKWTSCLEEPRDEDTLPWRQEYLKPYEIIPYAFYPRAVEVVIDDDEDDDDEEDDDEETSKEGSYSEHSEGELSEEEEEEEGTGSEWDAPSEEATRTGTEAEDPEAARKRQEIVAGKCQLEFASEASLRLGNDLTQDPELLKPEDGDPAAATSSTARRRRRRSPPSSSPTRPPVRPRTNAGNRPSTSDAVPPTP